MSSENELIRLYKKKYRKDKICKNYSIPKEIKNDERIIELISMLEWLKINKTKKYELVINHPLLTVRDHIKIQNLSLNYFGYTAFAIVIYLLPGIKYYKMNRVKNISMKKIYITHLLLSLVFGNSLSKIWFSKRLDEDISKIPEFNKYYDLNVDIEKIIQELNNFNIKLI
jgi:hypothetical protein